MVTALLLLLASPQQSILMTESYVIEDQLHLLPTGLSLGSVLEGLAGPAVYSIAESGGFSIPDPELFSIHGDSPVWNQHYLNGFNISDPLIDGAAAFNAPFRMLRSLAVGYNETPRSTMLGGLSRTTQSTGDAVAGVMIHQPRAGGIFPLALPIMDALSGLHSREREPPPPDVRRRFLEHQHFYLTNQTQTPLGPLRYAAELARGARRFLDFDGLGQQRGVFDEGFTTLSAGFQLSKLHVFGEYKQRDHMFAQLYHGKDETAALESGAIFAGISSKNGHAGLTLKHTRLKHNNLSFSKDLIDPDGESTEPYYPGGRYLSTNLDLAFFSDALYIRANNRALFFSPEQNAWQNALTYLGAPYGTVTHVSNSGVQLSGDNRVGLKETLRFSVANLDYNIYLAGLYALNGGGKNNLGFLDVGFKTSISTDRYETFKPYFLLAKTPLPISAALQQQLDPDYLNSRLRLSDGRLIDTFGGAHTTAKLSGPTNVFTAAAGFHQQLFKNWRLSVQGALKAYRGVYELRFEDGPDRWGYRRNGVYFLGDGEKRYELVSSNALNIYYGAHFQLYSRGEDHIVSVNFIAYNAVGHPPQGSGPLRNDIGVVHRSTANPNSEEFRLANLDTDRAFVTKILLGYRLFDALWTFLSIRHRDGTPFAFIDAVEDDGQVALMMRSNRGSPLKIDRPLLGPREDFHLNVDLKFSYQTVINQVPIKAWINFANLLDFSNELQELFGPRQTGRAALESEVPRSVLFGLQLEG